MAFCSNCGAEVEGKFCPKCGSAVGAAEGGAEQPQPQPPPQGQPAGGAGMTDNVAATLCYVLGFISGIIFLVLETYNKSKIVRFHAFQSIFLSVAYLVIMVAVSVILPFSLSLTLGPLIGLAFFVLWLFLLWKTYQDQKVVLPVVGPLAEKQA